MGWKIYFPVVLSSVLLTVGFIFLNDLHSSIPIRYCPTTKIVYRNVTRLEEVTHPAGVTILPPYYVTIKPPLKYLKEPFFTKNDSCGENACVKSQNTSWTMATFVKSSVGNFARRALLRRTWGNVGAVGEGRFHCVFIVGKSDNSRWNALLQEEYDRYGDVLQFDGPDDYRNIAQKTLAGMQWAGINLPPEFLYSSADDDFLVNLGGLADDVGHGYKEMEAQKWPEFPIMCGFVFGSSEGPMRSTHAKWYLSELLYRWTAFPPYCHGGFYTTSVSVAKQLYEQSRSVEPLPLDDVWITGMLRQKIGMPDQMVFRSPNLPGKHFNGFAGKGDVGRHDFMHNEWEEIFKTFAERFKICAC